MFKDYDRQEATLLNLILDMGFVVGFMAIEIVSAVVKFAGETWFDMLMEDAGSIDTLNQFGTDDGLGPVEIDTGWYQFDHNGGQILYLN